MNDSYVELVTKFAEALDLAIYDREIDLSKRRPRLLVDADVAIEAVVGLTAWDPSSKFPDVSQWSFVVKALLSTGYLPRIRLLSPHLIELDRFIGRVPKTVNLARGSRKENLKALADYWDLARHDSMLKEAEDTAKALERFVMSEGFEVFVKLELCYGGAAYDRLLRVCQRIEVVESEFIPIKLDDHEANRFAGEVLKRSRGPKARRTINNRVDGYALAELARRVKASELVRFYTHTDALVELSGESEFLDDSGRTVFRTPDYFVMRSSFKALRFEGLSGKKHGPQGSDGLALEELVEIRNLLIELLENNAAGNGPARKELERTLKNQHGEFGSIEDLINNFKKLNFLSEVFLRWNLPSEMSIFVPYLKAKFERGALVQETRHALSQSLEVVSNQLDLTVGHLREWKQDYIHLHRAIGDIHDEWEKEPDLWRDLGLGRWGLETALSDEVKKRLIGWVETVYRDEVSEQQVSDFSLAVATKDYSSSDDFVVALCVLWALKLYKYIVREWEELRRDWRSHVPAGLKVLYLVSKIKLVNKKVQEEPEEVISVLRSHAAEARAFAEASQQSPDPIERAVGFMCLAHVTYWAWNRARELGMGEETKLFAEDSFNAGCHAAECLSEGSLMWAFAINHSAYLGVRARLDIDRTENLLKKLGELNEEHYHYRIADTRARAFTEQVTDLLTEFKISALLASPDLAPVRMDACDNVRAARNLLEGGGPWFGDLEVKRHRETLDDYGRSLRCASLLAIQTR